MGWATPYIDKKRGETVQFRPRGHSMAGKIESGQLCTVVPATPEELSIGDIVLCKVNGFQYLHLIKAIQGKRFQIGNNRGRINVSIHTKGGPKIYEECRKIGGCPIGDAVITTGGNLKARHVIHAVGPVWRGGAEDEDKLLASAYRRSLEVAVQNRLRSISIPSISTGAFGYPLKLAAPLAIRAVVEFLQRGQHDLDEVRLVLYQREDDRAYPLFADALQHILADNDGRRNA